MVSFKKPLFTGFAPNLTKQDLKTACSFLFFPWNWFKFKKGPYAKKVEDWLKKYFAVKHTFTFDSGRSALHYALKACGAGEGDEILVQAFTCVVVSNAINWTNAKPVYVDIDNNFNMDATDLKNKITSKSKALIIQHTFGTPANLDELLKIAKENNLKIIEDCAHSLGAKYENKLTGTFGDVGMFSFGSDKIVSCVRGGALITNNDNLAKKLTEYSQRLPHSDLIKVKQHLLHFPVFAIGKPLYNLKVGKWFLGLAKKFSIINKIIYQPEKKGKQVLFYPSKLPNALAKILLNQLTNLEKNLKHRREIADIYEKNIKNEKIILPLKNKIGSQSESVYLRYPILTKKPAELLAYFKKQGIILGNWYRPAIAPADIDEKATGYTPGFCPNAEKLSAQVVNLPTNINITKKDAGKIVDLLNKSS